MGNKAARDFKKIGHGFESAFDTVIIKPAKGIYHGIEKIEHADERVIGDVYGGIRTGVGDTWGGVKHVAGDIDKLGEGLA